VSFITLQDIPLGQGSLSLQCLFGVFASIQFLRGRSTKPLLIALMLGGAIDIIGLVILPAVQAQDIPTVVAPPGKPLPVEMDEVIPPYHERLEASGGTRKITWGIVILGIDAAFFVYLCTAGVRGHFEKGRIPGLPPL